MTANGAGPEVDINRVLANLQNQIAKMAGELALRDAYIAQLEERVQQTEATVDADH